MSAENTRKRWKTGACAWIVAGAAVLGSGGIDSWRIGEARADDSPGQPVRGDEHGGDDRGFMREKFRAGMQRQLEQLRQREEKLKLAMKMMDEGKPFQEIRAAMKDIGPLPEGGEWGGGGDKAAQRPVPPGDPLANMNKLDAPLPGSEMGGVGSGGPPGPLGGPAKRMPAERKREGEKEAHGEFDEQHKAFVSEFLEVSAPEVHERFKELSKRDPEEARRKFASMFPRVRFLYEMRQRDPAMFGMRLRDIRAMRMSIEAARAIAKFDADGGGADTPERAKLVERLRVSLNDQYGVRTEILAYEVDRLRKQHQDAAAMLENRAGEAERIVNEYAAIMVDRAKERMHRKGGPRGDADGPGGPEASGPDMPTSPGRVRKPRRE